MIKNTKTIPKYQKGKKNARGSILKTKKAKYWKKKAWTAFSIMIRVLYLQPDGRCSCYTCGKKYHWKELQAGHFLSGRKNAVLFDKRQVRPQCYTCNCCNHGEQYIFGEKLRLELGEDIFQKILLDKQKTVKYSVKDYQNLEIEFKKETEKIMKEKRLTF